MISNIDLKEFLDSKVLQYNNLNFIESDPIQIPHLFTQKEDIEIAGFLAATISWGNRKSIINIVNNAKYFACSLFCLKIWYIIELF